MNRWLVRLIKVVVTVVGSLILVGFSYTENAEATPIAGSKVQVNADYLNVRSGGGTQYPIVDGFRFGEITEVGGNYTDWLIVKKHNNGYGYSFGQYLIPVYEQPSQSYTSEDIYWLSRIVNAEAGGESYTGKVAVANVVLHRVKSSQFPNTIKGVVFQSYLGIPQFSPVADGSIYKTPSDESVRAAKEALNGNDVVPGAMYFYNPDLVSMSNWIRTRTIIARIGGHVFTV